MTMQTTTTPWPTQYNNVYQPQSSWDPSYSGPSYDYGSPIYNGPSIPSETYGVQNPNYISSDVNLYYPQLTYPPPPPTTTTVQPPAMSKTKEVKKSFGGWFWEKLMKKFDLILISKIILKVVVFKKIVKFIGLIMLFMFYTAFMTQDNDQDDKSRRIKELDSFGNKR